MWEIKFRAWDKVDGWCGAFSVHMTGLVRTGDSEPIWQTEEEAGMVLTQFTGIHDASGKEIYEGDIVRWNSGQYVYKSRVVWDRFAYFVTDNYRKEFIDATGQIYEVIGNIYENPDLLK